ncbi:MAG: HDOD domain-containing protein [Planctomycetota bacterium]|jgi:HD-like signal output (HDOD) protein|nr:HDOD domain-containing protein [Planctomycetota bacterium]
MADNIFRRFREGKSGAAKGGSESLLTGRGSAEGQTQHVREAEILAAIDRFPALPEVVSQILNLVGAEGSSAKDMEDLVQKDMAIAGRLLKLVNSPFYGLPNRITSITQAVAIIGFGSLRSLVLAASTAKLLQRDLAAYGYLSDGLWLNALVTGTVARRLAQHQGASREVGDEYFIAGLLRDVGMLVLGPFIEQAGQELRGPDATADILTRERIATGFDHCWVGERVADKWTLPDDLRLAITRHHRIPDGLSPSEIKMMAAIRIAERLAFRANIGLVEDHPFDCQMDARLIEAAGVDASKLKEVVVELPEIVAHARSEDL